MNKKIIYTICVIALCSLLTISLLLNSLTPLQQSIKRAIDYLKETDEPYALLWMDVMYRRFGITEFANALPRYDQLLAECPGSLMRVFRRIAVYNNSLYARDLVFSFTELDKITVPALYCDRINPPDDYPAMLEAAVSQGGYMLTHALLACIWMENNNYKIPLSNDSASKLYDDSVALINDDYVVDELELEAAAFIALSGQSKLVNGTFTDRVIAVQNSDGGWSEFGDKPGESNWHTTVVGLLFLLHVEYPADTYPPVLATSPPIFE